MDLIYLIDLFDFFLVLFIYSMHKEAERERERDPLWSCFFPTRSTASSKVVKIAFVGYDNTKDTIMEVRYKSTRYTYKERDRD